MVPDWGVGDKVDCDIGFSNGPARLQTDRMVRQAYARVNYFPQSGTMNLVSSFYSVHDVNFSIFFYSALLRMPS